MNYYFSQTILLFKKYIAKMFSIQGCMVVLVFEEQNLYSHEPIFSQ